VVDVLLLLFDGFSRRKWVLLIGVHVLQLGGVVLVDLLQEFVGGLAGHPGLSVGEH